MAGGAGRGAGWEPASPGGSPRARRPSMRATADLTVFTLICSVLISFFFDHFGVLGTTSLLGLFSNIWLWRGVAGVLTAAVILILCIQFVNRSSAKDFPVCPSLELCPSGWLYFQRKCYYLSESEANWNSSQSLCSSHNASLLVIENDQELSFMVKITKQDPWIGLYKRNEEFFWVNGKALDNKLIEVKGSGNCAYLESKGVSASGCYLTRKWVCSLNISLAQ